MTLDPRNCGSRQAGKGKSVAAFAFVFAIAGAAVSIIIVYDWNLHATTESTDRTGAFIGSLPESAWKRPEAHSEIHTLYAEQILDDSQCDIVARFPRLRIVHAMQAPVTDKGLTHLSRCATLEELNLSFTGVTDNGIKSLAELPSLRTLWIRDTKVSAGGVLELLNAKQLTELDIVGIAISDATVCEMSRENILTSLSVTTSNLTERGIACIGTMSQLERLSLVGRPLFASEIESLARLPHLRELFLSVPISRDEMMALSRLATVEKLAFPIETDHEDLDIDTLLVLAEMNGIKELCVSPYVFSDENRKILERAFKTVRIVDGG